MFDTYSRTPSYGTFRVVVTETATQSVCVRIYTLNHRPHARRLQESAVGGWEDAHPFEQQPPNVTHGIRHRMGRWSVPTLCGDEYALPRWRPVFYPCFSSSPYGTVAQKEAIS